MMKFLNGWLMINTEGGDPTRDEPTVSGAALTDAETTRLTGGSCDRVADAQVTHDVWRARGAGFLSSPANFPGEIRCCLRDPDGNLIEVGQQKKGKWDEQR